jgi:hypothetical protein
MRKYAIDFETKIRNLIGEWESSFLSSEEKASIMLKIQDELEGRNERGELEKN